MSDLHDLTALEQAAAIGAGEVSSLELTEHYLARIDKFSDTVGAFITVTADLAREQARARDIEVRRGELRSPLHGVPVPVKDLNLTAGIRTTFGSTVFADFAPDVDDHVVSLLRDAGTVLLGKTNTPEMGLPCYTENAIAPPARTPWDLERMAGGSSGGAAAAVAAGLAPVAHGNDGGGSVRIPASCCGLVGLKPSRGRISGGPVKGDVSGLPVEGALARTVLDAAALLDVMARPMPGDPHWAPPLPPGETFAGHAARPPGRLRVGRFAAPVIAEATLHPEVQLAYDEASRLLEALGHEVEDVDLPVPPSVVPLFETVWSVLSTLAPVDPDREAELQPLTRHLRGRGRAVDATTFALAVIGLQGVARHMIATTASYDVLLSPTLAQPPLPVGAIRNEADPARDFEDNKRFTPFTAIYNLTGQPAISLPLHWTDEGLPVGVMLAGRPAGEAGLLAVAAQLEAAAPWHHRKPPLW
ncbi:MAG: amidase [Actinomycetota bacterium]|nr:amidase [Actinomycetota bacterium]